MLVEQLDDIDLKILRILQEDSNLTVKELAAKIHLSPSPTFERQKRLEREGYIKRYTAVVDSEKVGNQICVLCNIRLKQHTKEYIEGFVQAIEKIDAITECYDTSGDYDFLAKVYAKDMHSYHLFLLNTLGKIHSVGNIHSTFIMSQVKDVGGVFIGDKK